MISLQGAVYSDIGPIRDKNEDNLYWEGHIREAYELGGRLDRTFKSHSEAKVYAISDGIGGLARGEIASRIAVAEFAQLERYLQQAPLNKGVGALDNYVRARNGIINSRNQSSGSESDIMGATLSALIMHHDRAYLLSMGDSAIFRLRKGELSLLSRDDSHAARMRSLGYLTNLEARNHPLKNSLTNFMGKSSSDKMEYFLLDHLSLQPGDRYLLCSDGLSAFVPRENIQTLLAADKSLYEIMHDLVDEAGNFHSNDNLTLILLEIESCETGHSERSNDLVQDSEDYTAPIKIRPTIKKEDARSFVSGQTKGPELFPLIEEREGETDFFKRPQPATDTVKELAYQAEISDADMERFRLARQAALKRQEQKFSVKQNPLPVITYNQSSMTAVEKQRLYDQRYMDTATRKKPIKEMNKASAIVASEKGVDTNSKNRRKGGLLWFLLFVVLGFALPWGLSILLPFLSRLR